MHCMAAVSLWGSVSISSVEYILTKLHKVINVNGKPFGVQILLGHVTYLSIICGMMTVGRNVAKCCNAWLTSTRPILENMACIATGLMDSTKLVMSSSVSLWLSGMGVSHVSFLYRSLQQVASQGCVYRLRNKALATRRDTLQASALQQLLGISDAAQQMLVGRITPFNTSTNVWRWKITQTNH